jgi:NTP pyrophosphatase (non-canonical NTP hydrolase)
MKLEYGKKYVTRNGAVVGPMGPNDQGYDEVYAFVHMPSVGRIKGWTPAWTADGKYWASSEVSEDDLVAESLDPPPLFAHSVAALAAKYVEPYRDEVLQLRAFNLNRWSSEIHAANAHFYRDINTGAPIDRNVGELIALIHSEVTEMLEGVRKNKMDDKLPHRKQEEVEAADILIRLLDYCGYRNLDLGGAVIEKLAYNKTRQDHTNEARRAADGKKF